ncbi:FtsK/SpoIIIE family DNA translocase [Sulfurospirillum sp. 1612]|uniref:FtsK/SpoIIIE family DNA translocase n=1 Tax=Sulfurospirillum sp. 1612 TaxID=3094835 RepID=UPI002F94758A
MVFLGLSTVLGDTSIVGLYGAALGGENYKLFGYLSYVYPFLFIVLAYFIYKNSVFDTRRIEIYLASILLFLALLMIQSVVIDGNGYIGYSITQSIIAYIGIAGVWICIIAITALSVVMLFDLRFDEILLSLKKDHDSDSEAEQDDDSQYFEVQEVHENKEVHESQEANEKKQTKEEVSEERQTSHDDLAQTESETTPDTSTTASPSIVKKSEILNEVEENKKLLDEIEKGRVDKPKNYELPSLRFLANPPKRNHHINESEIDQKISNLLDKLKRFKIDGDVVRTYSGPVVTTFEFKPAPHIKVSKILTLQDDLAMALKAKTIRIQAPIPGKDVVGIEVPNKSIETIYLKEILESDIFKKSSSPLTIALGKDIVGNPFVTDLKKLPHLLIAGTTGSGKSVGINAMLLSLLYRNSPDTLKLLMIDPKMLEFSIYNDIPHLLTPVITKPKHAIVALSNMVNEMERRYKILTQSRTKNIENYNEKVKKHGGAPLPYIVVIIDELADLMMTSGKEVEFYISRLAQMARASGIHLLVATQRPSVDVVTGLIKANLPSRISFKVGQKIDSKVILDASGADSLLGRGDMLFTPPSTSGLIRLHAPYASEEEIERVVEYLKKQRKVEYDDNFLKEEESNFSGSSIANEDIDELFEDAKNIVINEKKCSISYIQRRLQIGYNRAARIVEQLEATGILSSVNSKGQREIL